MRSRGKGLKLTNPKKQGNRLKTRYMFICFVVFAESRCVSLCLLLFLSAKANIVEGVGFKKAKHIILLVSTAKHIIIFVSRCVCCVSLCLPLSLSAKAFTFITESHCSHLSCSCSL